MITCKNVLAEVAKQSGIDGKLLQLPGSKHFALWGAAQRNQVSKIVILELARIPGAADGDASIHAVVDSLHHDACRR